MTLAPAQAEDLGLPFLECLHVTGIGAPPFDAPSFEFRAPEDVPFEDDDAEGFFDAEEHEPGLEEYLDDLDALGAYDAGAEAELQRKFLSGAVAEGPQSGDAGPVAAPIFPSKGYISKLRPADAKAECLLRTLETTGGKKACVARLKAWQDLNRPAKQTTASAGAAAARQEEAEKWQDTANIVGHDAPEYAEAGGAAEDCGLTHESTPFECFSKFIPATLVQKWSHYSQKYARRHEFGTSTYKRGFRRWTAFTVYCLMATYILHGLDPRPSVLDFFTVSYAYPDNNVRRMWNDVKHFQAAKASFQVSISHHDLTADCDDRSPTQTPLLLVMMTISSTK